MFSSIVAEIRILLIQIMWMFDQAFANFGCNEKTPGILPAKLVLDPADSSAVDSSPTWTASTTCSSCDKSANVFFGGEKDERVMKVFVPKYDYVESYRRASLSSIKQMPRDVFTDIWIESIGGHE